MKAVGRYPEELLPLRPAVFNILVVLGNEKLHGYDIMKRIGESSGGRTTLLRASTVYGSLKRMLADGLIEEASPDPASDERRRYYALTGLGREVALAEVERLEALLRQARAESIVAESRSKRDPVLGWDPVRTGTRDGSENHDLYLYGG